MSRPPSLSSRIGMGLLGYVLLVSLAVMLHGLVVNEMVERKVWQSLLSAELDHLLQRRAEDPDWRWTNTETLELHEFDRRALPATRLAQLAPGLHDEVLHDGRELVVNVSDIGDRRIVLALDIGDLESTERELAAVVVLSALVLVVFLVVAVGLGVGRLVRPMGALAERIGRLDPRTRGSRIDLPRGATNELEVINDALNGYLARSDAYLDREREFIDTASHELRTPIAVMTGAAELALAQPGLPAEAARQMARIHQTARDVEQLVALLLVLARSPERLEALSDRVALDQLLPEIVEDHLHLCHDKDLTLSLGELIPTTVHAPLNIVQAALGNLLRNAIENSDNGEVRIWMESGPVVVIEDPGHGLSPEAISRLYRRLARGGARERAGIGLSLIARLSSHLGWVLEVRPADAHGTQVRLDLSAAVVPATG